MCTIIRYISLTLVLSCVSLASQAQASIDKIVKILEKDQNVETLYNETRNPKTKKIISSRVIITFDNANYCNMLKKAFRDERVNTVRCRMSRGMMDLEFEGGVRYSFYYSANNEGKCTLMIRTNSDDDDTSANIQGDGIIIINPDQSDPMAATTVTTPSGNGSVTKIILTN